MTGLQSGCGCWMLGSPIQQVLTRVPGLRSLLASYLIVSVVYSLGIQLYGPFLRSLVECEHPPLPEGRFSGSAHCGDADYVLAVAQAREGSLVSMKLVVHAIAGPFLGSLADRLGRRPVLLMGVSGYAIAFLLLFMVDAGLTGPGHRLVTLCFLIEGATNAFDVVYMSMIADMTPSGDARTEADRSTAFSAYFICNAGGQVVAQLLSVWLLRKRLESYAAVWVVLFFALVVDVLFVWCYLPETLALPDGKEGASKAALTVLSIIKGPFQLVSSEPFLRMWLLSVILTNLAAGLPAVLASFSIAVYGWSPGDLQACTWFSILLRVGSIGLLSPHAHKMGSSAAIVLFQIFMTVVANLIQVLAPFSPAALLGPGYVVDTMAFANPANAAFLSTKFGGGKQAGVNSVQHLCSNLSTSVSIAIFSSPLVFRPGVQRSSATRPFVLAFLLSLAGGVVKARLAASYLGTFSGYCAGRSTSKPTFVDTSEGANVYGTAQPLTQELPECA